MKILVIGADTQHLHEVVSGIKNLGNEAQTAHDAETAEKLLEENVFAAVVLNMDIPEGGGISFLLKLKRMGKQPPACVVHIKNIFEKGADEKWFLPGFIGGHLRNSEFVEGELSLEPIQKFLEKVPSLASA